MLLLKIFIISFIVWYVIKHTNLIKRAITWDKYVGYFIFIFSIIYITWPIIFWLIITFSIIEIIISL